MSKDTGITIETMHSIESIYKSVLTDRIVSLHAPVLLLCGHLLYLLASYVNGSVV